MRVPGNESISWTPNAGWPTPPPASFPVGAASSALISFAHLAATNVGAAFFLASGPNSGSVRGFSAAGYPYASNLAAGQNVSTGGFLSGTATMAFVSGFGNSQFLGAGIGFLGFRFDGGLGTQHGWARVDMSGAPVNSFRIVDYAFTTAGEQISAGQVPELPAFLRSERSPAEAFADGARDHEEEQWRAEVLSAAMPGTRPPCACRAQSKPP